MQLISREELSKLLHVSKSTIISYEEKGIVKPVKLPETQNILYNMADIEKMVKKHTHDIPEERARNFLNEWIQKEPDYYIRDFYITVEWLFEKDEEKTIENLKWLRLNIYEDNLEWLETEGIDEETYQKQTQQSSSNYESDLTKAQCLEFPLLYDVSLEKPVLSMLKQIGKYMNNESDKRLTDFIEEFRISLSAAEVFFNNVEPV